MSSLYYQPILVINIKGQKYIAFNAMEMHIILILRQFMGDAQLHVCVFTEECKITAKINCFKGHGLCEFTV